MSPEKNQTEFRQEITLVGIRFTHNKEYLRSLPEGVELHIVPEPDNKYDPNAIAVWHADKKIGYLPQNSNHWLSKEHASALKWYLGPHNRLQSKIYVNLNKPILDLESVWRKIRLNKDLEIDQYLLKRTELKTIYFYWMHLTNDIIAHEAWQWMVQHIFRSKRDQIALKYICYDEIVGKKYKFYFDVKPHQEGLGMVHCYNDQDEMERVTRGEDMSPFDRPGCSDFIFYIKK